MAAGDPMPDGIGVETMVEAGDWPEETEIAAGNVAAVRAAVRRARPDLAEGAEVAIILSDDDHLRELNRRFREKDASTNVLSFPAAPPVGGRFGPLLGDILLARETVLREASERGIRLGDYVTHLVIHGFLHLVGYDHQTEKEAVVMEGLETFIMEDLGLHDPYAS
ncbi:rRNA maturation RNase YbeY [Bauldia sp.]|uniref:rRNA maturation RNase YbeY n=1 Tax=Bauldia sp. TaxID=2575872 RepID=UPI0025BD24F5|nr:rRNA maturation RNase YbeY [Bauldia sp.]